MSYNIQILNIPPVVPPVSEIEYQIDSGTIVPIAAAIDDYPVGFLPPGTYTNRIRGKNAIGVGPWSANKNKTIDWDDIFSYYNLGQGYVYDLFRIDTLWQDHLQTDPVTDYGQPVGYQLDLSGNGNHRSQSDVAKRPIYGRHPASGIRQLQILSEDFANAAWAKLDATVAPNVTTAPDGTNTASKLVEAATNNQHATWRNPTSNFPAAQYTSSVFAKAAERDHITLTHNGTGSRAAASFNLSNGTVRSTRQTGSFTDLTASIVNVGNGWYRCSCSFIAGVPLSSTTPPRIQVDDGVTALNDNGIVYSGDGTSGIFIWGAMLENGLSLSTYQRSGATLWDISEAGSPDCFFLAYDGINDSMRTVNTIDATAIDEVTCILGQRRDGISATSQFMIEFSENSNANPGFNLQTQLGSTTYTAVSRGTTLAVRQTGPLPITDRSVLRMQAKIGAPLVSISRNGSSPLTNSSSQGTGTYGNNRMHFGARNSNSQFYAGREYFNFCAFKLLSPEVLDQIERFAGTKAGVTW